MLLVVGFTTILPVKEALFLFMRAPMENNSTKNTSPMHVSFSCFLSFYTLL
jgi:hypothetical protein